MKPKYISDLFKINNCANNSSQGAAKFVTTPPPPIPGPILWSTIQPADTKRPPLLDAFLREPYGSGLTSRY